MTDRIIKIVANHFNISPNQLSVRYRSPRLICARQFVWLFFRENTPLTYTQINAKLGTSYDHTTIMSGVKNIRRLIRTKDEFRNIYDNLSILLK